MDGKTLNKLFNIGAEHALYREDGGWYHHLKAFPGVLFDKNGYLIFKSQSDYLNHPNLRHRQDLNVIPGISFLDGYVPFTDKEKEKIILEISKEVDEESLRIIRQINSIVRDTAIVKEIKKTYDNTCQICGVKLEIRNGVFYSEVHHIKPLGKPHNGADKKENMICVCPNHHVLLDFKAIKINFKALKKVEHIIKEEYILYHNNLVSTLK